MTANRWRLVGVRPISFAAARICANNAAFIALGLFSNATYSSINRCAIGASAREIQGSGRISSSQSSRRRPVSFFSGSIWLSCPGSIETSGAIGRFEALPVISRKNAGFLFRPRVAMGRTYCNIAQISNCGAAHECPDRSDPLKVRRDFRPPCLGAAPCLSATRQRAFIATLFGPDPSLSPNQRPALCQHCLTSAGG